MSPGLPTVSLVSMADHWTTSPDGVGDSTDSETELGRALLLAQQVADEIVADARTEAAAILERARLDAAATVAKADARLADAEEAVRSFRPQTPIETHQPHAPAHDGRDNGSRDGPDQYVDLLRKIERAQRRAQVAERRADGAEAHAATILTARLPGWLRDLEDRLTEELDLAARRLDAVRVRTVAELQRFEALAGVEAVRTSTGPRSETPAPRDSEESEELTWEDGGAAERASASDAGAADDRIRSRPVRR